MIRFMKLAAGGFAAATLLGLSSGAAARDFSLDYTAHFTCGENFGTTSRLERGQYRTTVAARNRSGRGADVDVELALTFPPGGPNPGSTIDADSIYLEPGQAFSVDCDAIDQAVEQLFGSQRPPYIQGLVTLSSRRLLDVTAMQSAGAIGPEDERGPVATISVNRIPPR